MNPFKLLEWKWGVVSFFVAWLSAAYAQIVLDTKVNKLLEIGMMPNGEVKHRRLPEPLRSGLICER